MSQEAEELFKAAVSLPEAERAALVVKLLDSIAGDADVSSAQARESASRLAALEAGELELIDSDEALRLING